MILARQGDGFLEPDNDDFLMYLLFTSEGSHWLGRSVVACRSPSSDTSSPSCQATLEAQNDKVCTAIPGVDHLLCTFSVSSYLDLPAASRLSGVRPVVYSGTSDSTSSGARPVTENTPSALVIRPGFAPWP